MQWHWHHRLGYGLLTWLWAAVTPWAVCAREINHERKLFMASTSLAPGKTPGGLDGNNSAARIATPSVNCTTMAGSSSFKPGTISVKVCNRQFRHEVTDTLRELLPSYNSDERRINSDERGIKILDALTIAQTTLDYIEGKRRVKELTGYVWHIPDDSSSDSEENPPKGNARQQPPLSPRAIRRHPKWNGKSNTSKRRNWLWI
ncbi:hypothetical protein R1sor_015648 [Riccia sorocarpa]|uniref:Uncharacterized protein n=1 Tax=Riccia sorocarpa TaxID=122646 RepID=A0ABD3HFU6_9MARC